MCLQKKFLKNIQNIEMYNFLKPKQNNEIKNF